MTTINIGAVLAGVVGGADSQVSFTPAASSGNVFVNWMPPKPDVAVGVMVTGSEYELGLGMADERITQFLVKVRTTSTAGGWALTTAISDHLHGFRDGGTWTSPEGVSVKVIRTDSSGAVLYEYDENNLPVHVVSVTVRWSQPS